MSGTLADGPKSWSLTLPPFGIQARRFSSRVVKIGAWTPKLGPAAQAALARQVAAFEQRMANLEVERPYCELQNPDFEFVGDAGQMLGWQPRIGSAGSVDLAAETSPVTGRSLHLKSEDALGVAVQSHLFPHPVDRPNDGPHARPRRWSAAGVATLRLVRIPIRGATRQRYVALGT